jgi:hypothetical protein
MLFRKPVFKKCLIGIAFIAVVAVALVYTEEGLWIVCPSKYYVQGETIDCSIMLEGGHMPQSVEFTPAEDISVSDWKNAGDKGRNRIAWTFKLNIEKTARLGDRKMVIIAQDGRSQPCDITIVNHVPIIANFELLETELNPAKLHFRFQVFDNKADLPDLEKETIGITLTSQGQFIYHGCLPSKVTKVDNKTFIVEVILTLKDTWFITGSSCQLSFGISDKNGYCRGIDQEIKF